MAYDDSAFRRRDNGGSRDDFRTPGYETVDYPEPETTESTLGLPAGRRVPSAVLDDVFDDPEHGDPGRDRMTVHILWEIVLLLAVAAAGYLIYRQDSGALRGDSLKSLMVDAAGLGLLGLGAGLSLRAGAVNLALGPMAVAAALHFGENGDRGLLTALVPALIAAAAVGVVVAVFVVGFHVPGWAATLGAGLAVVVFIERRSAPVPLQGDFDPKDQALYILAGVVALGLLGGLLGTVKSVRRSVGRFRPVSDPARRRGQFAGLLTGGALVLSMIFAIGAGVLLSTGRGEPVVPGPGLELTGLAIGAALLGGTSAFGRRGGILGTSLAAVLITLVVRYVDARHWDVSLFAIAASAIALGLVVTRIVETFGRPASLRVGDDVDWPEAGADVPAAAWSSPRQESWSSALPAQPTTGRTDPW
jgi:ribose/xylose/arabinose/galactoside ABC-type transport system permease subunit